jgi:uncharacterized cupredoxin-like copper-binding protein
MRARTLLVACALTPLVLAACGSSNKSSDSGGSSAAADVTVVAPGGLKYDMDAYTAPAKDGGFGLQFQNKDNQTHSVVVRDASGNRVGDRMLLAPGKSKTETVKLPAGVYELYCDVPGHEAAGMKATLTVGG